ncbi:MAG: CDP-diacylglycerol--glycerol-3-phosphate 3-phosphatidyltransferase [Ignavibacteriae bacterium]|nr:MAG: CDP-diacylglycerol--glycerol-3-phosphate 3-phosphatidyltransferase [Ignavibacteriota bacterium]
MNYNDTITLPNSLTFLRILLTPIFLFLFISDSSIDKQISLAVFIVAALTDWYDGWAARKFGNVSRFGMFMDPLADKILSSTALIAFAYLNLIDLWMVIIIIIRDITITLLRSIAELKNQTIITTYLAKAKTTIQYLVIYYILVLYVAKTLPYVRKDFPEFYAYLDYLLHPQVLFGMMLLVTILTVWTGVAYIYHNRKFIYGLFNYGK